MQDTYQEAGHMYRCSTHVKMHEEVQDTNGDVGHMQRYRRHVEMQDTCRNMQDSVEMQDTMRDRPLLNIIQ